MSTLRATHGFDFTERPAHRGHLAEGKKLARVLHGSGTRDSFRGRPFTPAGALKRTAAMSIGAAAAASALTNVTKEECSISIT